MADLTIQPLLPDCQEKKIALNASDFNVKDALHYHPDAWSYYEVNTRRLSTLLCTAILPISL